MGGFGKIVNEERCSIWIHCDGLVTEAGSPDDQFPVRQRPLVAEVITEALKEEVRRRAQRRTIESRRVRNVYNGSFMNNLILTQITRFGIYSFHV